MLGGLLLTSCNLNKKYLADDQAFLYDNNLRIISDYPVPNKSDLQENLNNLYRQKETPTTIFGLPRHNFYYRMQKKMKKDPDNPEWKEDKFRERLQRSKPEIYDSTKAQTTTEDFEKYMGLRGYRFASASYKTKIQDKEAYVTYTVDAGPRLILDSVLVVAQDSSIQTLLDQHRHDTKWPHGSALDIELYRAEVSRLTRILQNNGYALIDETNFSAMEVDTSGTRSKGFLRLRNPTDSTFHQQYYVGSVTLYTDYDNARNPTLFDTTVNEILYKLPDEPVFTIKPEVFDDKIFLRPGELTQLDNYNQTFRGLSRMEIIRFVNGNGAVNTVDGDSSLIDYTFQLSRNLKIPFEGNIELNYSNLAALQRRSLLGTALSVNYRDLNTFRGAEVLNLNLETGFEFNFFRPGFGEPGRITEQF